MGVYVFLCSSSGASPIDYQCVFFSIIISRNSETVRGHSLASGLYPLGPVPHSTPGNDIRPSAVPLHRADPNAGRQELLRPGARKEPEPDGLRETAQMQRRPLQSNMLFIS